MAVPERGSLIGRWRPGHYLGQALRSRPVARELWPWAPLPAGFVRRGFGGAAAITIVHQLEPFTPSTPPPREPDWAAFDEEEVAAVVEEHHAAMQAWSAVNPVREHRFEAVIGEFMWSPRCPECGFEALPSVPEKHDRVTDRLAYRAVVQSWSEKAVRTFAPDAARSPRRTLQLDHIFPVALAVRYGIAEEVVAAPVNLQLLSEQDNVRKGNRPGMTIDELLDRYLAWVREHPAWIELVAHRRATGTWPAIAGHGYATTADRDAAHERRMQPVYRLWRCGYSIRQIAAILGMIGSTLTGRVQLDKRYCGQDSIFYRAFPPRPCTEAELEAVRSEHRWLEEQVRRQRGARRSGDSSSVAAGVALDRARRSRRQAGDAAG